MPRGWVRFPWVVTLAALLGGCAVDEGHPCTWYDTSRSVRRPIETVDLLFVIDDGATMAEEQAQLRAALPALVAGLLAPDPTESGAHPARSLHIGVITGDMGAGDPATGIDVPSCRPGRGGDGRLRRASGACASGAPTRVFSFAAGTDDEARFIEDVACAVEVGTAGCELGQPLEAALKALSPAARTLEVAADYEPPTFASGAGHGDGANAGFLRHDSVLAIVLLTDHDDCSVASPDLFSPVYADTPIALRCSRFPDALQPIERYVEGFRQLRDASQPQPMFMALVGTPVDLVASSFPEYEPLLADPRLAQTEIDLDGEAGADALAPSCDTDAGLAYPPRRIIELAYGLSGAGFATSVDSLCAGDLARRLEALRQHVGGTLSSGCIVLPLGAGGTYPPRGCDMHVVLPRDMRCEELHLILLDVERRRVGVTDTLVEREVCWLPEVRRESVGIDVGFYVDDFSDEVRAECVRSPEPIRFAFSRFELPPRAEARHVCRHAVPPSSEGIAQLGMFCQPFSPTGPGNLCAMGTVPSGSPDHSFECDPVRRRCGVACTRDDDCVEAGLGGYSCDGRSVREVVSDLDEDVPDVDGDFDEDEDDAAARYGFCVNLSCPPS